MKNNIILKIKPLSVNKCWQGRKFKTQLYKDYEKEMSVLLASHKPPRGVLSSKVGLDIVFYLKRASTTDFDNLLKPLFDILVANGIIPDDRYIWELKLKKEKAEEDSISIKIKQLENATPNKTKNR